MGESRRRTYYSLYFRIDRRPKGVFHVQQAMVQHYYTGKIVLDLREDDVYWCTADPGWVTGTSYGILLRG